MASISSLRERLRERMSAVSDELCSALEDTAVQYEAQIERQRELLDVALKPEVKLYRIDDPRNQAFMKQQLANQQQNSSLDQKDSEVTD